MGTRTRIQLMLSDEKKRKSLTDDNIIAEKFVGDKVKALNDNVNSEKATLEHNYWVLDGQYEVPTDINDFCKSTTVSNSSGNLPYTASFSSTSNTSYALDFWNSDTRSYEPYKFRKITITYGTHYLYYNSSKQIDFTCNGSKPVEIDVWIYASTGAIYSRSFTDTSNDKDYTVLDFGQEIEANTVTVAFKKLSKPNRTLKINKVYLGEMREFNEDLISANLLQETSYLTDNLPIGTLEFEVNSPNDEFNALNPDGIFDKLKINAPVRLITEKDASAYDYTTYFLKRWENSNNRITKFYCEDAIGLLQTTEGEYYTNYDLNQFSNRYLHLDDIETRIVDKCPSINVDLSMPGGVDTDIYYRYVLNNTNYRDVLQKLYFGFVNYFIVCNGNNIFGKVIPNALETDEDIYNTEDIIVDTDNVNRINAVKEILLNNHLLETEEGGYKTIYEKTLNIGTYEYFFDDAYKFSLTNFSYAENDNTAKHLTLSVASNNTNAKIQGYKLNPTALVINKKNDLTNIEDGSSISVDNYNVKYTTNDFAQKGIDYIDTQLINSLVNYYNGTRYQYTFSTRNLRSPQEALGRYIKVESTQGRKIVGNIIRIQTDLFNGLIYTITIDGVLED